MSPTPSEFFPRSLRLTAARWAVCRDRGLSATESIEYELWLAADPRHVVAMQHATTTWSRLDRLPESTAAAVLAAAAARRQSFWRRTLALGALAAAATVALGLFVVSRETPDAPPASVATFTADEAARTVTLTDGSLVQLNAGSEVTERFSATERHVILARGEAHFTVTKNPRRPFVVHAGALHVRAVGTAFNINLHAAAVDVIVTAGRVQLTPSAAATTADPALAGSFSAPALDAGERAVLRGTLAPATDLARTLVRSQLNTAQLAAALAWREPLLRLGGATLAELAEEFHRVTGKRLVFADPALAELRFGGRFRADDIDGFTHLLAATLDLDVAPAADGTIVLRKKIPQSR